MYCYILYPQRHIQISNAIFLEKTNLTYSNINSKINYFSNIIKVVSKNITKNVFSDMG